MGKLPWRCERLGESEKSMMDHRAPLPPLFSAALLFACAVCGGQEVTFEDVTDTMGVSYQQKDEEVFQFQEPMTGGAAAGDYDRDGWVDLFVTRHDAPPILFKNEDGLTFADVTESAGLSEAQPTGSNGAAWGDVDNDGDLDLYVTAYESLRYFLYINDGNGNFTEEGNERGASLVSDDPHYGQSAAFGDYDRDGFLDIHVTEWRVDVFTQNPNGTPSHNRLLRNLGAANPGHFSDVTEEAGVSVDHIEGDGGPGSWGFTSRFSDLDGDGWPDLAIAADWEESVLFWNNGDGTFSDGTRDAGVSKEDNGMGATTADFNADGLMDWFVTSIFRAGYPPHTGNRMYYNNGDRTFTDATDSADVRNGFFGWGTSALDYDNDGDQDLVETNGFYPSESPEAVHFAATPLRLWDNSGSGIFSEISASVGLTNYFQGRGLLTFDYDRDGDLDIFVVNHVWRPVLYRNDGGNAKAWLRIRTIGTLSNRDGIGALITVIPDLSSPYFRQVHEVSASSNFLSQNEMTVHVGLGDREGAVDLVEIRWPSGLLQRFEEVATNSPLPFVATEPTCSELLLTGSATPVNRGTIFQDTTYCGFELTGESATLSAHRGVTTRISFLDPGGDLVFVDFSSDDPATTMAVTLEGFSGDLEESPYDQSETRYARGLATVAMTNPSALTWLRVVSLGNHIDRVDLALIEDATFAGGVDGIADIKAVVIEGEGKIGAINAANANFMGSSGTIGIDAAGIDVVRALSIGDIMPSGTAKPVLWIGAASLDPAGAPAGETVIGEIRIEGGDLAEAVGDYRIDTGGVSYDFPIRAVDGQRSISDSPSRPDLGDGMLPVVKDTFVADHTAYFLSPQQVE